MYAIRGVLKVDIGEALSLNSNTISNPEEQNHTVTIVTSTIILTTVMPVGLQ